jgi:hypothetical protein
VENNDKGKPAEGNDERKERKRNNHKNGGNMTIFHTA